MTKMRFPFTLMSWRSPHEEAIHRRTGYQSDQGTLSLDSESDTAWQPASDTRYPFTIVAQKTA